jgi:hypothetical protein
MAVAARIAEDRGASMVDDPEDIGEYHWFETASATSQIFIGSSFTASNVTNTRSFFVEYRAENGCISERTAVQALINEIPVRPVAEERRRCGPGDVLLTASGSGEGAIYRWYTAGGTPLGQGDSLGVEVISAFNQYFVEAVSAEGCVSASRTTVTAQVDPIPAEPILLSSPIICDGEGTSVAQIGGAPQNGTYHWYESFDQQDPIAVSSSFTTPVLSQTTSFYASVITPEGCESANRLEVLVEVLDPLDAPDIQPGERCGTGDITMRVIEPNLDGEYHWFETASSTSQIFIGTDFTARNISASRVFYVEFRDQNGCISERSVADAIVNTNLSSPTVNDVNLCGPGNAEIVATSNVEGVVYKLFETLVGGEPIQEDTTGVFRIEGLTFNKTFYIGIESPEGCISEVRSTANVLVRDIPAPPVVFDATICEPGNVQLNVGGATSGGFYRWYDTPEGGIIVNESSQSSWTTPSLNQTTSYHVSVVTQFGCEGEREEITAFIADDLPQPQVYGAAVCVQGEVEVAAGGAQPGETYVWYESLLGNSPVKTSQSYLDSTFTTQSIFATTPFYVAIRRGSCEGDRKEIRAVVNPLPEVRTDGTLSLCSVNDVASLSDAATPAGGQWNGQGVVNGDSFSAEGLGSGSYVVEYVFTDPTTGCTNRDFLTVNVLDNEPVDAGINLAICEEGGFLALSSANPSQGGGDWSALDPIVNAGINNTTRLLDVTDIPSGMYTLFYTIDLGSCQTSDSISLDIQGLPSEPMAEELFSCGGGSVELSASGALEGQQYRWYNNINDANAISDQQTATVNVGETRSFFVSVITSASCESPRKEVTVTVTTPPVVDSGADLVFCSRQTVYDLSQDVNIEGGYWVGAAVDSSGVFDGSKLAQGQTSTVATYVFTDDFGCTETDSRKVSIGIAAEITSNVTDIAAGELVLFSVDVDAIEDIEWDFGDGFTSKEINPAHYFHKPGTYDINVNLTARLQDGELCEGDYSVLDMITVSGDSVDVVTSSTEGPFNLPFNQKEYHTLYPTEVNNVLKLDYYAVDEGYMDLQIIDLNGVIQWEQREIIVSEENTITMSEVVNLKNGMYLLRFSFNGNIQELKFIKR